MIEDYLMELELRGQSKNTIRNYRYTISNFLKFTNKSPENINEQDIKRYMRTIETVVRSPLLEQYLVGVTYLDPNKKAKSYYKIDFEHFIIT